MFKERRVKRSELDAVPPGDSRLVAIPGVNNSARKLHALAAAAFQSMREAIAEAGVASTWDEGAKPFEAADDIKGASGWRKHRWKSREQYEKVVTKKYGSVREGRKWLGYQSPHETGLAIDFGVGGLWPTKKTRKKQAKTELYTWLVDNAWEYGFTPYKLEPWHWEFRLPLAKELSPEDREALGLQEGQELFAMTEFPTGLDAYRQWFREMMEMTHGVSFDVEEFPDFSVEADDEPVETEEDFEALEPEGEPHAVS
jgi:hypothetical protein